MSILSNSAIIGLLGAPEAAGGGIERSVRFNSSDSAYLSRTPASAGNRKTWTWAGWVKRSALGTRQLIFGNLNAGASLGFDVEFIANDSLDIYDYSSGYEARRNTTQVFRDCSAWYHLVITYNSTNATAADRLRLYVNGVRVTAFANSTDPTLNADGRFNTAVATSIGRSGEYPLLYLSAYLADVHFIDGQALDPTSFGEFDANGVWQPKAYTGTYGTNGFHLPFSDNSTAAALGTDTSGNSNTWTVNNISVAAGAGNDSLVDVPTNGTETDTGVGGEVRGNYFTGNPLDNGGLALANGNLDLSTTSSTDLTVRGTIGITSGKWYWEVTATNLVTNPFDKVSVVGIATANSVLPSYVGSNATSWGYVNHGGSKVTNGSPSAYGNAWITNDVIGIAFDADNGKLFFAKNNTWQGSGDPAAGTNAAFTGLTSGPYLPAFNLKNSGASITINAGARPFAYTAPSGYKALCTTNLDDPLVAKPSEVMDVKLYTGNGGTQTISGLGFSPDLVWVKQRSGSAVGHSLHDIVRGTNKHLASQQTDAELDVSIYGGGVTAFNSDGFSVGSWSLFSGNNESYVAWTWDAGSSTVTNTQGSITSSVRANPSAGFSIVTYTGNGTAGATIGHGLGVAPEMIIIKNRDQADAWQVYHAANTANPETDYLVLNTTAATADNINRWNDTAPGASVFTLGDGAEVNTNTEDYVAYCFTGLDGYSAMGAFSTATASTDGVFVYTNHRPRWVLIKKTSATGPWIIYDAVRNTYNAANNELRPNTSEAENGGLYSGQIDILSNGFKIRSNSSAYVGEVGDFVYCSFAESPFQYARAR